VREGDSKVIFSTIVFLGCDGMISVADTGIQIAVAVWGQTNRISTSSQKVDKWSTRICRAVGVNCARVLLINANLPYRINVNLPYKLLLINIRSVASQSSDLPTEFIKIVAWVLTSSKRIKPEDLAEVN
jgi:hypothetical protein